ncbi:2'-O-ribose RNA methyltransferase, putative [Candida dubliniensis CD36]|uniref:AdoMet-dependent rRNA methyltransferase, putative n=1 Tax=Candida dubliniensis (strain CD36 / ATCC MYA-646 / CBS 7987 / NCPF 3949 / NRRL Y-17841) TaxID=573826 RepID=B9WJD0_CANDC|nr:2'-O-ribose RNA methyltransferase, putative [Candida dubliniensis CD36]CAX41353.1 2'-O-ribose RNA methyltransferase, putative [Candida dubliniensis CD36]
MGKQQKKHSKGRLDRYYYLAKEKGYRARSSFKIVQINEKYGHFLEKSKVVIDLCAAPGSWCQVASQLCPVNSLIIGVDIVPIKPLPNVITFQSDITTEDCRSRLRGHMKTWKADTVLHDGAPNVGLGWVQDAFTQSQLTLQALKLAVENLTAGGTFVTKIFRSRDYNNLMWVFQQLFEKVEATKPPASRNVSAEIFVVCKGFKAPKKLDPRLLDPKEVFEELGNEKQNNEAKIFNPEKFSSQRQRQGYEEGDYTLFHTMPIMDFIKEDDPINQLGSLNKFELPAKDDHEWKILSKLKLCTPELLECIKDLKVLGRKEFKMILKFRKQARDILGIDKDDEDNDKAEIEVEPLTEEQKIDQELQDLMERQKQKAKRAKKNANELKQKEIVRNQMNMLTDMNIGIEAAQIGADSLFNLKTAEKTGQLDKLAKGKKKMIFNDEELAKDNEIHIDENEEVEDSADELDELENQLDDMYHQYQARKAERDANYRAKQARGDANDEAWNGIEDDDDQDEDVESGKDYEMESESDSDSDDDEHIRLIAEKKSNGLSKTARSFFASDSIFNELGDDAILEEVQNRTNNTNGKVVEPVTENNSEPVDDDDDSNGDDDDDDSDFEIVPNQESDDDESMDSDDESNNVKSATHHKQKVDLATVEAMTLAHQVALGQKNKHDLIDEGINRYSFRDKDNLPDWFVDDEKRHSKIVKPITKEAALAIKEKQKQLNARPIKKVLEAQGRKKMRALRRLEKIKKKSDLINEDSGKSERDKADEIQKLMKKLSKKQKQKPKTTVVVARGSNRGLSGRPKGVKGKYKMVDGVMKNEQRALKRIAKKHKK